jgi:hypothetical protein
MRVQARDPHFMAMYKHGESNPRGPTIPNLKPPEARTWASHFRQEPSQSPRGKPLLAGAEYAAAEVTTRCSPLGLGRKWGSTPLGSQPLAQHTFNQGWVQVSIIILPILTEERVSLLCLRIKFESEAALER